MNMFRFELGETRVRILPGRSVREGDQWNLIPWAVASYYHFNPSYNHFNLLNHLIPCNDPANCRHCAMFRRGERGCRFLRVRCNVMKRNLEFPTPLLFNAGTTIANLIMNVGEHFASHPGFGHDLLLVKTMTGQFPDFSESRFMEESPLSNDQRLANQLQALTYDIRIRDESTKFATIPCAQDYHSVLSVFRHGF